MKSFQRLFQCCDVSFSNTWMSLKKKKLFPTRTNVELSCFTNNQTSKKVVSFFPNGVQKIISQTVEMLCVAVSDRDSRYLHTPTSSNSRPAQSSCSRSRGCQLNQLDVYHAGSEQSEPRLLRPAAACCRCSCMVS